MGIFDSTNPDLIPTVKEPPPGGFLLALTAGGSLVRVPIPQAEYEPPTLTAIDDEAELTVEQLRAVAAELEIPGRSSMNKAELIEAIAAAEQTGEGA